jgi:hypothetical protein
MEMPVGKLHPLCLGQVGEQRLPLRAVDSLSADCAVFAFLTSLVFLFLSVPGYSSPATMGQAAAFPGISNGLIMSSKEIEPEPSLLGSELEQGVVAFVVLSTMIHDFDEESRSSSLFSLPSISPLALPKRFSINSPLSSFVLLSKSQSNQLHSCHIFLSMLLEIFIP